MSSRYIKTVPSNAWVFENCSAGQNRSILDVSHSLTSFGTLRLQLVTRNVVLIGWRQQLESNQPARA